MKRATEEFAVVFRGSDKLNKLTIRLNWNNMVGNVSSIFVLHKLQLLICYEADVSFSCILLNEDPI